MFDASRMMTLEGTVRQYQWTNPHCYIQLQVAGERGDAPVEWSVEMAAPMHLQGAGWTRRTLRPGDRIRVTLAPLRNGRPGGEVRLVERLDGVPLLRART